jgi:hypothetical protein
MNWIGLTNNGDSYEDSFESFCDQLFESWCRRNYKNEILAFSTINGAGGDGGVESLATLANGNLIGLQAKWFPTSLGATQLRQIKDSLLTAITIHPKMIRYIVALPRNLSSLKKGAKCPKAKRWDDFLVQVKKKYPNVSLELWDENQLLKELEEPGNQGIKKYWFVRSEISKETLRNSYEKSKQGWLKDRYLPELNVEGEISAHLLKMLGAEAEKNQCENQLICFAKTSEKLKQQIKETTELDRALGEDEKAFFGNTIKKLDLLGDAVKNAIFWTNCEGDQSYDYSIESLDSSFASEAEVIDGLVGKCRFYSHYNEIKNSFDTLRKINLANIFINMRQNLDRRPLCFFGAPGTGKTQGVAALAERILKEDFHLPLLIQARGFEAPRNWLEIIIPFLGLSAEWNEEELWDALEALAHRQRVLIEHRGSRGNVNPKILIIVDGIDESSNPDSWAERINETATIVKEHPSLRFCFTSRTGCLNEQKLNACIVTLPREGDAIFPELFWPYLKAYHITIDCPEVAMSSINNPLSLRLFCDLNKNKNIVISDEKDLSLGFLLKQKIDEIDQEYVKRIDPQAKKDEIVLRSLVSMAECFASQNKIELNALRKILSDSLSIGNERINPLLDLLESYGVIGSWKRPSGDVLAPAIYDYYPGQQGYFDFATASFLLKKYGKPELIPFDKISSNCRESLYILAILSIRDFGFLITDNPSFPQSDFAYFGNSLPYYALRHSAPEIGQKYKARIQKKMLASPSELREVVNELIIPLSPHHGHPLGSSLLNEYLSSFDSPALRDRVWSIPELIESPFRIYDSLRIRSENYRLNKGDTADGLPVIYAWALSSLKNTDRQAYRIELIRWARLSPNEFFKLFQMFAFVNDPQIRSDMFSLLMCSIFDDDERRLLKPASSWVMEHILSPQKREENRNIAVRYYSIAILKEAVRCHVLTAKDALPYLPPYHSENYSLPLDEGAFAGDTMSGYSAITYDLARYVLFDHIEMSFRSYGKPYKTQIASLLKQVAKTQPIFKGRSYVNLVLSSAYKYLLLQGWNQKEFQDHDPKAEKKNKIDSFIFSRYWPSSHGSQSPVMTIAEKYLWQARYEIEGFLGDHMKSQSGNDLVWTKDYGSIDDFVIPSQEAATQTEKTHLWHIGEENKLLLEKTFSTKQAMIEEIKHAPDFSWEKWIQIGNERGLFPLPSAHLLVLASSSYFESSEGLESSLTISSVIIPEKEKACFIRLLKKSAEKDTDLCDPYSWHGALECQCYLSPKEACWFPWKKRYENNYDPCKAKVLSTTDSCTYNSPDSTEINYSIPSEPIRTLMDITNFDGQTFFSSNKTPTALFISEQANNRNEQRSILIDESELLSQLKAKRKTIVYLMEGLRINGSYSEERFGQFRIRKTDLFVGYFSKGKFHYAKLKSKTEND